MKLSETCGFGTLCQSLVRDRLILGVKDDRVREKLLGKRDLNLDKAIEVIKASQVTHSRASEISDEFCSIRRNKCREAQVKMSFNGQAPGIPVSQVSFS